MNATQRQQIESLICQDDINQAEFHDLRDLAREALSERDELLAALKRLSFNCEHGNGCAAWTQDKEKARAAIAKAEQPRLTQPQPTKEN